MRNKFLLAILIGFSALLINCKGENKEEKQVTPEIDNSFKITMNLVVPKDDDFQFFYNEDGSDIYTADKCVTVSVKGSPDSQDVVFKLPQDVIPESLRFDIGSNKEQGDVKINKFTMEYMSKKFSANGDLFYFYLGNNSSIKYDREKGIATPLPNNPEGYDPIFTATEYLKAELKKLTR